jgi:hypothetical protein
MDEQDKKEEFLELPPVPQEAIDLCNKVIAEAMERSYGGRHPEIGKMIKCQACGLRHRSHIECKQKFVYLYSEEEIGPDGLPKVTDFFRTAVSPDKKPTRKQVFGAQAVKGKRFRPHKTVWSR